MRQGLCDRRLGGRGEREVSARALRARSATARIAHAPSQVEQPRGAEAAAAARPARRGARARRPRSRRGSAAAARWPRPRRAGSRARRRASRRSPCAGRASSAAPRWPPRPACRAGSICAGWMRTTVAARLASHPWIASARAVELPAGRLLVDVVERHRGGDAARARLRARPSPVDANGTPFAPAGASATRELPRLVQSAPVAIGEPDPALAEAVDLAARLARPGLPRPLEIEVAAPDDPTGFCAAPRGLRAAHRSRPRRSRRAARTRSRACSQSGPPDAAGAATLDLRFADQVVLRGTPPRKRRQTRRGRAERGRVRAPTRPEDAAGSKPGG